MKHAIAFDFTGVPVSCVTDAPALLAALAHDFSHFVRPPRPGPPGVGEVRVEALLAPPPYAAAPALRPTLTLSNCVVFEQSGERWVDYHGRALSRFTLADERATFWSEDVELLHELVYLFILSRVGELHDRRGLHRVHALGLAVGGRGVLCLMPSGGGKTTLGLAALAIPGVRLLSDDTPLLRRDGALLGFANRIGASAPPAGVAPEHVRVMRRTGRSDKWLIDVRAFPDRLAERADPAVVLLGERQLGGAAGLDPLGPAAAAPELFSSVVVGLGLPQVVEYFLRFDARDVARKAALVASRAAACAALLARAEVYRFRLARDGAENVAVLSALLARLGPPG